MTRRSVARVCGVVAVLAGVGVLWTGPALAHRPAGGAGVLRASSAVDVHMRPLARGVESVAGAGSFAYLSTGSVSGDLLLGDGSSVLEHAPKDCSLLAVGDPWMLISCDLLIKPGDAYVLYNPATRREIAVKCGCENETAIAAGRDWIWYTDTPPCPNGGDQGDCTPAFPVFQSVRTGKIAPIVSAVTGSYFDLNSPTLTRPLCSPVQTPGWWNGMLDDPIQVLGRFVLTQDEPGVWSLHECGHALSVPLAQTVFPTRSGVFWNTGNGARGILFPSLRRITLRFPSGRRIVAATDARLFFMDATLNHGAGTVWVANAPSPASVRSTR